MTDLSQQTELLLKAGLRLHEDLLIINYDLWVICGLIFVFGAIIAFKRR